MRGRGLNNKDCRGDSREGKPAPDIYIEAAHRLGVTPTRCVAMEDSDAGVLAASAA